MSIEYPTMNETYALGAAGAPVTLTTSFLGNVSGNLYAAFNSQMTFFVSYRPGLGGGGNSVQLLVTGSPFQLTFFAETAAKLVSNNIAHTAAQHSFVGSVAATTYNFMFCVPVAVSVVRLAARENVVGGAAGTLTVRALISGK